jgi:hypothetical protein
LDPTLTAESVVRMGHPVCTARALQRLALSFPHPKSKSIFKAIFATGSG